ncbi:MAG: cation:proton antiporter [Clostridiales bacterium]|nr:cation:proton antiporter [Clostridiales bacterium]
MDNLLALSIALIAGLLLSRLAKVLKLPAVTAYLVAGILVGPFVLGKLGTFIAEKTMGWQTPIVGVGFINDKFIEKFSILSEVALGFIAFSIGNEFRLSQLKKIGKQATIVGILQAVVTTLVVDAVLVILYFVLPDGILSLEAAIVLGAIASATAPAATLMVVKQYKAKGPLTDILLPVVALDDAVGLILFAISFGVAGALKAGSPDIIGIVVEPLLEIVCSLGLGALMGYLFSLCERFFHSRSKRLAMSVAFVLLTIALAMIDFKIGKVHIGFSNLLVCMMLGTIFCNVCDFSEELMDRVDRWTAPLFIIFFVISGAELDLTVFKSGWIIVIGLVYILSRSAGKYSGAFASAKLSKCDDNIVKYLGVTLLPQAGVALGMARMASSDFGADGALILQITLFAVLVYELIGPMLTKIALTKAGDINPEGKTTARNEHAKNKHRLGFFHRHGNDHAVDTVVPVQTSPTEPNDKQ